MTEERFLTRNELCKILGVSRCYVYKMEKTGAIPEAYLFGSVKRWRLSEVLQAVQDRKEATGHDDTASASRQSA